MTARVTWKHKWSDSTKCGSVPSGRFFNKDKFKCSECFNIYDFFFQLKFALNNLWKKYIIPCIFTVFRLIYNRNFVWFNKTQKFTSLCGYFEYSTRHRCSLLCVDTLSIQQDTDVHYSVWILKHSTQSP